MTTYSVVFTGQVVVLTIRHAAQRAIRPEDVESDPDAPWRR